jgi:hypothetical protein
MTKRIALTVTILAALAAAVPAFAGITVYSNDFKSRSDYHAIKKQAGKKKKCKRNWRKKSALGVTVKGGKQVCQLKTPVEGDSLQPDLIVRVEAKVTGATEKAARKGAFVGVTVRSSRKDGYTFRVIPKTRKWELVEDKVVLEKAKDKAVKGIKKKNVLEIRAKGDTIIGKVNGKTMTSYKDPSPEDVKGTGTGLAYGIKQKVKKKDAVAFFDKLKVQVPNP